MPLAHGDVKEISRKDSKSVFRTLVIAIHILRITTYVLMYTLKSPFVSKRKNTILTAKPSTQAIMKYRLLRKRSGNRPPTLIMQ